MSTSELIRLTLGTLLPRADVADTDPWRSLAGFGSPDVRVEPGEVDEVVYPR